jgi:hypothetical protein
VFLYEGYANSEQSSIDGLLVEFLQTLFGDAGFSLERGDYVEKDVENLKEQKFMHRKWIQCVFTKPNNK